MTSGSSPNSRVKFWPGTSFFTRFFKKKVGIHSFLFYMKNYFVFIWQTSQPVTLVLLLVFVNLNRFACPEHSIFANIIVISVKNKFKMYLIVYLLSHYFLHFSHYFLGVKIRYHNFFKGFASLISPVTRIPALVPRGNHRSPEFVPRGNHRVPEFVPRGNHRSPEFVPRGNHKSLEFVPRGNHRAPELVPRGNHRVPELAPRGNTGPSKEFILGG